ncbi:MAG: DUF2142 domain-containing protein [Lachnospiraceae bacterium]|nr:DUF2142 domain-containing protein [Lachnospiraceae bacterium]
MVKLKEILGKTKYIWILVLAVFAGLLLFVKDNIHLLGQDSSNRGEIEYKLDDIEATGFQRTEDGLSLVTSVNYENTNGEEREALIAGMAEGLEQTGRLTEDESAYYPSITLSGDYRYVQKLKYVYDSSGRVETVIFAIDDRGEPPHVVAVAQDYNNQFTDTSIQAFRCSASKFVIVFMVANDCTVKSVSIDNAVTVNWIRFFFAAFFVVALCLVLTSTTWIDGKLENIFAVLAFLIGMSFIFAIPAQKTGWDECTHFKEAYTMFGKSDVGISTLTYMDDTKVWPLNQPQTYEEYGTQAAYVNENAAGDTDLKGSVSLSGLAGYLAPAVGIAVGKFFHLPFTVLYKMGKVCSLLLYIALVYMAIKRMSSGKRLLMVMALLPTPVYMSTIYNRDSVILACSFLATAYLFSLFYEEDSRLDWKSFGIIMGALFVVCVLKPVYVPMMFIICMLPKDKFVSRREKWSMIGAALGVFVLLVAAMVLPRFIGSSGGGGDLRGLAYAGEGAVIDSGKQLSFIFGDIFGYAKLLLRTINNTFMDYTLGGGVWGSLGHYAGMTPFIDKLPIFLVFLILTDTKKRESDMTMVQRLGIFVLLAVAVAMTWTSMYLAFTAVGSGSIQGVQARYYLPILLPFFMLFNTKKIKVDFNGRIYTRLVILVPVVLSYLSIYKLILAPYCS